MLPLSSIGPVAQRSEQGTHNSTAAGSIPAGATILPPPAIGMAESLQVWLDSLSPLERELLAWQLSHSADINALPAPQDMD